MRLYGGVRGSRMTLRDPVESLANSTQDLYDISTWEPRTTLDRLVVRLAVWFRIAVRWGTILLAVLITVLIIIGVLSSIQTESVPTIGVLTILSAIPALLLAVYIYMVDVTTSESTYLLAATFVLSVAFASFAYLINTAFLSRSPNILILIPLFYLVVGPVEETVKLLAVRLFAYRKPRFDAVIDGAVYGAVAGLGFATIENVLYITQHLSGALSGQLIEEIIAGSDITATRALAGPGHVIYSAFAGYYLGLAKFNEEYTIPIILKGVIIAAFIHATYNTLAGLLPGITKLLFPGAPMLVIYFGFITIYDGLFGYLLFRKIDRYRRTYKAVTAEQHDEQSISPERTEFDG